MAYRHMGGLLRPGGGRAVGGWTGLVREMGMCGTNRTDGSRGDGRDVRRGPSRDTSPAEDGAARFPY